MSVAVLVPWRPGDPHREAAWSLLQQRHHTTHPTWDLIEGHPPDGPWCKAAAVADALAHTDADTIIVHDADVWCDGTDLAVEQLATHPWAIPHGNVCRLKPGVTDRTFDETQYVQPPYPGIEGGGIVALPRTTYEACPLDPRFLGWGQEDESWALALHVLAGEPWRGDAPLWHLWHPPPPRESRVFGSRESKDLHHRYVRTLGERTAMARLIKEAIHG